MFAKKTWLFAVALSVGCNAAALAEPITVYNNFGPGNDGFEVWLGWSWMLAAPGSGFDPVQNAQWFQPGASGPLSDIYIGLRKVIPPYRNVFVRLCADNNFEPPTEADILEEWLVDTAPLAFAGVGQAPPVRLVSVLHPMLDAQRRYVLWVGLNESGGSAAWQPNIYDQLEPRRQRTYPYGIWTWQALTSDRAGALRVDIVPEPASLALLLFGLLPVVRRR